MFITEDKFLKVLFVLIPLSLSLSTFTAEIFSLIFTALVLSLIIRKKYFVHLDKNIFIFLSLFHIFIFMSASLNTYPDLMFKGFGYARFLLLFFILIVFFNNNQNTKDNQILKIIFILFFIILLDAIIQFINGKNILGFEIINNRVSGIFGDELILGSFVLRFLPILLWFMAYLNFDFKKNNLFIIILFFLSFFVIFISGGRTSFFLTIFFITSLLIFLPYLRKKIIISLLLFFISILLIKSFNIGKTNPTNRIFLKTYNQITDHKFHNQKHNIAQEKNQKYNLYFFSKEYENHYKLAIYLFKNNFVKGVGTRGFRSYCREYGYDSKVGYCSTHPHNTFLQIASELGLIGVSFYLMCLIFFLNQCLQFLKKRDMLKKKEVFLISISISSVIINFFPLSPSSNFFGGWSSYFYYFTLAMFIFSISNLKHIKRNKF